MTLVEKQPLGVPVLGYGEQTDNQVQIFLHGYTCVLIKLLLKSPNEMEEAVRAIFNEACNFEIRMRSYGTYADTDLCSNEMWVPVPS